MIDKFLQILFWLAVIFICYMTAMSFYCYFAIDTCRPVMNSGIGG